MPRTSSGQQPFSPQSDGGAWVSLFVTCPTRVFCSGCDPTELWDRVPGWAPARQGGPLEILVPSPSAPAWALARSQVFKKEKAVSLWNDLL